MTTASGPILNHQTLLALIEASQAILSELELSDVFKRIAERAAAVLHAECASVLLFNAERKQLVFQAATGPGSNRLVGERFDATLGIAGQVALSRRAVRIDDVRQNNNFFRGIDTVTSVRTRQLMAAPLVHRGEVLGVVEVINARDQSGFTDGDLELLQIFSNLAAAAASPAQALDRVRKENRGLRAAAPAPRAVGRSPAMVRLRELIQTVARASTTVLLSGETGTGKEVTAREIHAASPRADMPFIGVNCAALSETLLESELFGHEKGAFTGATAQKPGHFELASGGTLFLDEVGEMALSLQAKLLRALEERAVVRVGGTKLIPCDARIVAATNRNLKQEVSLGGFREDLYYRLHVFPIELPPLRQRIEDVPPIVEHFLRLIAPSLGTAIPGVSDEAMSCLMRYGWPGNIRELRNVVERAALLAGDRITPQHLPPEIAGTAGGTGANAPPRTGLATSMLEDQERALLARALDETKWNQSAAARRLGISRDLIRYRMKKYDLKASPR